MMNHIKNFFKRVEATPVPEPTPEELVDGKAIKIQYFPQAKPYHCIPEDEIQCSYTEKRTHPDGTEHSRQEFIVTQKIGKAITVDTIAIIRFNDSLGFKNAIGAVFGEKQK